MNSYSSGPVRAQQGFSPAGMTRDRSAYAPDPNVGYGTGPVSASRPGVVSNSNQHTGGPVTLESMQQRLGARMGDAHGHAASTNANAHVNGANLHGLLHPNASAASLRPGEPVSIRSSFESER